MHFIFSFLLICLVTGFESKVFATAGAPTVTGTLPRSSGSSFNISVTVPNITVAQEAGIGSPDNLLTDRLAIYINEASPSSPVSYTCPSTTGVLFKVEAPSGIPAATGSAPSYSLTYNLVVTECTPGTLTSLLGSNSTINIIASFSPTKGSASPSKSIISPITRLNSVPAEAPAINSITGLDSSLQIQFSASTTPKYIDGSNQSTSLMWALVFDDVAVISSGSFNLPTKIFVQGQNPDAAVTDASKTCQYAMNKIDGDMCVICATPNTYIDAQTLSSAPISGITAVSLNTNTTSKNIGGLTVGNRYAAVLMYDNGTARSTCRFGIPIKTRSMMELAGEGDATASDSKCFIATAAYGTPHHPNIEIFRWFRSAILLKTTVGRKFVHWYYKNGPVGADFISEHVILKNLVAGFLWVPAIVLFTAKWLATHGFGAILGVLAVFMFFAARRRIKRS